MAVEIERKFLVRGADWRHQITRSIAMDQGYLGAIVARCVCALKARRRR